METTIQKWGNSQGLRLAQHVLKQAGVSVGDPVIISVQEDVITIRKPKRKKFKLSELIKQIPTGNKPYEHDWGKPAGKEVW